jgi:hypothetical protein
MFKKAWLWSKKEAIVGFSILLFVITGMPVWISLTTDASSYWGGYFSRVSSQVSGLLITGMIALLTKVPVAEFFSEIAKKLRERKVWR